MRQEFSFDLFNVVIWQDFDVNFMQILVGIYKLPCFVITLLVMDVGDVVRGSLEV